MRYRKVRFSAEFDVTLAIEDGESVSDAISDIDIPESPGVAYVEDSFELVSVKSVDEEQ